MSREILLDFKQILCFLKCGGKNKKEINQIERQLRAFFQTLVARGENFSFSAQTYSVQPINHLYNQITCQLARFFQKCLELGTPYQILDDTGGVMDN